MRILTIEIARLLRSRKYVWLACGTAFGAIAAATYAASNEPSFNDEVGPHPVLVEPHRQLIPEVKIAKAIGWPENAMPRVVDGFTIQAFARGLDHPRWLYVLPNGDVLVAETNAPKRKDDRKGIKGFFMKKIMKKAGAGTPSANRITLLRDEGNGTAEQRFVFLQNLESPFGMALIGNDFYVANTDAVLKFHYSPGDTTISGAGEKIADLPAGSINHHWTKNIIASPDGEHLYATVGSNSNAAENGLEVEKNRAAILDIDLRTRTTTVFASGLRNSNGLDWQPNSHQLWAVVNERDEIGDHLVPDYMTAVHRESFYGWPFSYYGAHIDQRVKPQDEIAVSKAIAPDYALGSHTASLGLVFYPMNSTESRDSSFPAHYRGGVFIGQHGSWNRHALVGYEVSFVPFDAAGQPAGAMEEFVTGFLDEKGHALGRPVGVAVDRHGALLIADDVGDTVWRVAPKP